MTATVNTCRKCYYCIPNIGKSFGMFLKGTCYQAKRTVFACMTACSIFEDRRLKMVVKSTPEKRNKYRDADDNLILGVTLPEILDKPLVILAKREYTWGLYTGLAVKAQLPPDKLAIVEITAGTPIKALNMPSMPKPPYKAMFVEKTSKNNHKYFTVVLLDAKGRTIIHTEEPDELPF